mgnify:CR=1 FL=1
MHSQLLPFRFGTWLTCLIAFCSQCQHFTWLFFTWDHIWSGTLTTISFDAVDLLDHLILDHWAPDRFLMIEIVFDMWLLKCWSFWSCIMFVRWSKIRWRMRPSIIPIPRWIWIYIIIGRHPWHWHWRHKIWIWIYRIRILILPIPILGFAPTGWSWCSSITWPINTVLLTYFLIFFQ